MVRIALGAALQKCPSTAVSAVAARALNGTTLEVRMAAIRVLGACGFRTALDPLLTIAQPRRGMFGLLRTAPKSAEYLAALGALQGFPDDTRARDILSQAARSRDPEIAAAATTPPPQLRPSSMVAATTES